MSKQTKTRTETRSSVRDIRETFLESRPDVRELWEAHQPRREIALAFVHIRTRAGLSQAEVAKRAGWNKSYVSRLESMDNGSVPDTETLARYARACEMDLGLVFAKAEGAHKHRVVDVVPLQVTRAGAGALGSLRDQTLADSTEEVSED